MDSRKKQSEQSLPLAESGAATASPSAIPIASTNPNASIAARTVAQSAIRVTIRAGGNIISNGAKPTTGVFLDQRNRRIGFLQGMERIMRGMSAHCLNSVEDALFVDRKTRKVTGDICSLTTITDAANLAALVINAVADFFVAFAIRLLSAWKLSISGESRLSPILRGINE
jgi:hypothetical protein